MKPNKHSKISASKFGGIWQDYIKIHELFDNSKSAHATMKHRAMLHNSWGIYLITNIFGDYFKNSDGDDVSVRDVAEQHVLDDLGFIPSLDDWLKHMSLEKWMGGPIKNIKVFNIEDKQKQADNLKDIKDKSLLRYEEDLKKFNDNVSNEESNITELDSNIELDDNIEIIKKLEKKIEDLQDQINQLKTNRAKSRRSSMSNIFVD